VPAARSSLERKAVSNVNVLFMDARNIGFQAQTFDIALCGFMGWDDCFDFVNNRFFKEDRKAPEIFRVLRDGGRFVGCSWEAQEDLAWMEEAMLRYCPSLLKDDEYLRRRPIGMSYEKAVGYEVILHTAGFGDIDYVSESAEFISTDEEEWWRQMEAVGWESLFEKIKLTDSKEFYRIKESILRDLALFKYLDGIHFTKSVFFVSAVK
jgi:SAM-dependent methyltransferase